MYGVIVTISHGKAVQTRQTGVQALRLWGYGTRMVQKDPTSYFGNFREFLGRSKCALHLRNSQHRTSLLLPHLSVFTTIAVIDRFPNLFPALRASIVTYSSLLTRVFIISPPELEDYHF